MCEWIKKSDKLPSEGQEILFSHTEIYNPLNGNKVKPTVFGGWYRQNKVYSWFGEFNKPKESQEFTHWMPMPDSPKE